MGRVAHAMWGPSQVGTPRAWGAHGGLHSCGHMATVHSGAQRGAQRLNEAPLQEVPMAQRAKVWGSWGAEPSSMSANDANLRRRMHKPLSN